MFRKCARIVWLMGLVSGWLLAVDAVTAQGRAGTSRPDHDLIAKLDAYMDNAIRVNRFRGAVLVARDGRPIFSRAYGMANEELEVPNSTRTVFRLGSVTKGFTAAAVMLLQEQGKLRIGDPLCQYLDECPAAWRPVTVRHLLMHTSGIPSYTTLPDYGPRMPLPVTHETLIARVRDLPLQFAPGTQSTYSNTGYYLLGVIIERSSGKTYADFLQEHIFAPLGMTSSGYDSAVRVIKNRASGYSLQNEGALANARYLDMTIPGAAGALYSSVEDLLRWDQALYSEKVLSRKSLDEMFTPAFADRGYGWMIRERFDRKAIEHDGGINGFAASLSRFPDERVTVIVLANIRDVPTRDIANNLTAIAFARPYAAPKERKPVTIDPKRLERYVGQYRFDAESVLSPNSIHTVSLDGDRLMRRVNDRRNVPLHPESETEFFLDVPGISVTFELDAAGRVTAMIMRANGREARAEKIR